MLVSHYASRGFKIAMDDFWSGYFGLVTLSLSVIDSNKIRVDPHPALFSEVAASLKKKVKRMTAETGKSGFMFEQRQHV
jgi:EAL domain-containing protein (putative c-di-GMP-specific phosphodiesterase class I)